MRSKLLGFAAFSGLAIALAAGPAFAQAKGKTADDADKVLGKQMDWEKKVMGEDGAKKADMRKIAEAKRLQEEARKNPEPAPAPKVKDPNKEGVRAKGEASIGLAIDSDKPRETKKAAAPVKKAEPSNSANDELGALVASSLAEDSKSSGSRSTANLFGDSSSSTGPKSKRAVAGKANRSKSKAGRKAVTKRKGRTRAEAPTSGSGSLDRLFAATN